MSLIAQPSRGKGASRWTRARPSSMSRLLEVFRQRPVEEPLFRHLGSLALWAPMPVKWTESCFNDNSHSSAPSGAGAPIGSACIRLEAACVSSVQSERDRVCLPNASMFRDCLLGYTRCLIDTGSCLHFSLFHRDRRHTAWNLCDFSPSCGFCDFPTLRTR